MYNSFKQTMMEMRWLEYEEEETIVPPVKDIQYGKPFDKGRVIKQKLQYRQKIDTTVRAGGAGTWDNASLERTSNYQWSDWIDIPTVRE